MNLIVDMRLRLPRPAGALPVSARRAAARGRGPLVEFPTPDGVVHAVDGLTFTVHRGETLGIVGESGSGKSVTNLALLGLLNRERTRISGTARFMGQDLISAPVSALRKVRGKEIAMIFQDPFACLHPMYRWATRSSRRSGSTRTSRRRRHCERAVELLGAVGIPNPRERVKDYPHQYSGGMRQRAMIAMAMVNNPDLLIADEPTTALDVTVQAQILELIDRVKQEFDIGVILITHDLGVIAEVAQTVMVMYAGRSMELGSTEDDLPAAAPPVHVGPARVDPARRAEGIAPRADRGLASVADLRPARLSVPSALPAPLLALRPGAARVPRPRRRAPGRLPSRDRRQAPAVARARGQARAGRGMSQTVSEPRRRATAERPRGPLVEVEHLTKRFPIHAGLLQRTVGHVHAVEDVSFTIKRGETLGLVGESGCGKSTTARLITKLLDRPPARSASRARTSRKLNRRRMRPLRREMQIVFQDPYSSLNPRQTVGQIIGAPFAIHRTEGSTRGKVQDLMDRVGLNPEHYNRYPHEFSGGQRQRIGVARALALSPKLIVCDEPVSALDVSIQAQILNLLHTLQRDFDLTYLFISHDLGVVRHISDRIAVMYLGRIVELGRRRRGLQRPAPSVHGGAPLGRAEGGGRRRRPSPAHRPHGRRAVAGRSAARLLVPSPLPEGAPRHRQGRRGPGALQRTSVPELDPVGQGQLAACWYPLDPADRLDEAPTAAA